MTHSQIYWFPLLWMIFLQIISTCMSDGQIFIKILLYSPARDMQGRSKICSSYRGKPTSSCFPTIRICAGQFKSRCDLLRMDHSLNANKKNFDWSQNPSTAPTFIISGRKVPSFVFMNVQVFDSDESTEQNSLISNFQFSFSPEVNKVSVYNSQSDNNDQIDGLEIQVNTSCLSHFRGSYCEFMNPCFSSPCQNNGHCLWTDDRTRFKCSCQRHFNGSVCQHFTPCLRKLCLNGGECTPNPNKRSESQLWVCKCPDGFFPPRCEPPNLCKSQPCQNGGICKSVTRNGNPSFQCQCLPFFSGSVCQIDNNPCKMVKCLNNGVCAVQRRTSSTLPVCKCTSGFSGNRCEIKAKKQFKRKPDIKPRISPKPKWVPKPKRHQPNVIPRVAQGLAERSSALTDSSFDTSANTSEQNHRSLNVAVVIILTTSGIVLIVLVIAILIVFRRRQTRKWETAIDIQAGGSGRTTETTSEGTNCVSYRKDDFIEENIQSNQPLQSGRFDEENQVVLL